MFGKLDLLNVMAKESARAKRDALKLRYLLQEANPAIGNGNERLVDMLCDRRLDLICATMAHSDAVKGRIDITEYTCDDDESREYPDHIAFDEHVKANGHVH